MNKEERFAQELEHDIKKKTMQLALENGNDLKFSSVHRLLKCCGFKIKNEEQLTEFAKHLMSLPNCGEYLGTYNCLFENTMFYLRAQYENIKKLNFAYLNTETTCVLVESCERNNICFVKDSGVKLKFEAINQCEFDIDLTNKEVIMSASCFAGKASIKERDKKTEKLKWYYKSVGKNSSLAKMAGIITKYKKNLNTYTNVLYDEITINCFGVSIAVIVPDGLIDANKIKTGNILICSGFLTAIILKLDSRVIDENFHITGVAGLKKYYITITKNKNALVAFNLKRNGETDEKKSYIFPTKDIMKIKLKPYYNMLYNYQMTVVVKKGKNFKCFLTASNSQVSKMLNELNVNVEI